MVGRDRSVSKTNWLHVDIFWVFFIRVMNILSNALNGSFFFLKSQTQPVYLSLMVASSRLSKASNNVAFTPILAR